MCVCQSIVSILLCHPSNHRAPRASKSTCNLRACALKGRQVNKSKQQHVLLDSLSRSLPGSFILCPALSVSVLVCGGKSICLALLRIRIAGQYSTHSHNEKWLAAALILRSSSCDLPTHSNREQLIVVIISS